MPINSLLAELKQAAALLQQARFTDAETLLQAVLQQHPEQPDALHLLAVLKARQKDYSAANTWFSRALKAAPARTDFLVNFANALQEQGDLVQAESLCRQALAHDPAKPEVLSVLGSVLLACNRFSEAEQCLRRVLQQKPDLLHALNNLGNALQRQGRHVEALASYHAALQLQPTWVEALLNQGVAEKALGRISAAAESFSRVLALQPGHARAALLLREVSSEWLAPLLGRRLVLRMYREDDADFLQGCFTSGAFVSQYNRAVSRHQSVAQLRKQLAEQQTRHPSQNKSIDWVICAREGGRLLGLANLVDLKLPHGNAEFLVGIPAMADRAGGAGLEASLLVLEFAFNVAGLNKVTSYVYADNPEAQQNTLALGFSQEALLREHIREDSGRFLDVHGNALLVTDFRSNIRLARLSQRLLGRDITRGSSALDCRCPVHGEGSGV